MSVLSHLDSLGSGLVLTSTEAAGIQTSVGTLASRLSGYFSNIQEKFTFGSYDRDVILPRKIDEASDVDYMVVFNDLATLTPQTGLNRLKKFAEDKYSRSEIYQSSPTLVLELNHIKFELVPAHKSYSTFYIPAPASSYATWISTDPQKMKDALVSKNTQNSSKIKPLVRIMKYWNVRNGKVYSSFELENMIVSKYYISCSNLKDYFYDFVGSLQAFGLGQSRAEKIDRLKKAISEVKANEIANPGWAEERLKKELPSI